MKKSGWGLGRRSVKTADFAKRKTADFAKRRLAPSLGKVPASLSSTVYLTVTRTTLGGANPPVTLLHGKTWRS